MFWFLKNMYFQIVSISRPLIGPLVMSRPLIGWSSYLPQDVSGTLDPGSVTHCVLSDTLGQQAGVDPDGGFGNVEDPGDLNNEQKPVICTVYKCTLTCSTASLPTSSSDLSPTTWSYQAPPIMTVSRVLFPWGNVQLLSLIHI